MSSIDSRTRWTILGLVGLLGLSACGDDPVGAGDDDDHGGEVEGVVLVMNAQTLATYDGEAGTWTGELEVHEGEETPHIDVRFVDHDGNAVELDDDFYLEVRIDDESIAEFEQDTPGEFGGHLHGKSHGMANAVFRLMHGSVGSGHADFETAPVHIHVEEAGGEASHD